MQLMVLCFNLLGVVLAIVYAKRLQLYAGLPEGPSPVPNVESELGAAGPLSKAEEKEGHVTESP